MDLNNHWASPDWKYREVVIWMMPLVTSIVVLGMLYALLGAGFVIIYRANRVLNFAHAEVVIFGAYLAIFIAGIAGNLVIAVLGVLCCSFVLGLVVYTTLIRPLVGYSTLSSIIVTVALGVVLNAFTILGWRGVMEVVPFGWNAYYEFPGGIYLSGVEITSVVAVGIYFVGMDCFYRFSPVGQAMRATAERPLLAAQRGIRIYFISGIAWGMGFVAAALAGILLGMNYTVSPEMAAVAVAAFVVALVGGLDSLWGTLPAAFIIAAMERLTITYINPRLAETVPFVLLVLVLMLKPWGLFGTEEELDRV